MGTGPAWPSPAWCCSWRAPPPSPAVSPSGRLTVSLPADADPADATQRIRESVGRLRYALESDSLPAIVRIRTARHH